jgi:hypothetical protein
MTRGILGVSASLVMMVAAPVSAQSGAARQPTYPTIIATAPGPVLPALPPINATTAGPVLPALPPIIATAPGPVLPALPPIVATTPGPVLPALPPIVATAPGPVFPGPAFVSPDLPTTGVVVAPPNATHKRRNQRNEPHGHRRHNARPGH